MIGKLMRYRLPIGVAFLLASLSPYLLSSNLKTGFILTLFYALYCVGITFVSDYICEKIRGKSFLLGELNNAKSIRKYFLIGQIAGLIFDGLVCYLGGVWFYPFYSTKIYFVITLLMFGFAAYFLSIISSYLAVKYILDKKSHGTTRIPKYFKWEPSLYKVLGVLGVSGIILVIGQIMQNTAFLTRFSFSVNILKEPYLEFEYLIIAFFSIWFTCEYVSYKRKRSSLLKDIFHGYYNSFIAIYVAATILAVYMEVQNLPIQLWIYVNWPWQEIKFLGLPVMIYFTWPLHYIGFLSIYRAFGDGGADEVWAGDSIP